MIPKDFIADLITRVDIIDVVGDRIKLKKNGANYTACCPFHNEKTPSFTVSQSKQFYYCFGCGAHGNAISFLMEYDKLDFVSAIENLAAKVGLEVPREKDAGRVQDSSLINLLGDVSKFYVRQLKHSNNAIEYLKQRGLDGHVCRDFNIGFAPDSWDSLLNNFKHNKNGLSRAGLLVENKQKSYDRFRNRIIFPIKNHRGQVIAFGGRALGDSLPKYLNSPETELFHKGSELYGLFEARLAHKNLPYLFVVEGYMDVVALAQHEIKCAVATLGTSVTENHVRKLFRYTEKIIFCFDGDKAGRKAAWRALENTLSLMHDGVEVLFLFLPEGEDPDSQVRKEGKDRFLHRIKNAMPLSDFFYQELMSDINVTTMAGRAQLSDKAISLLNVIPAGVFQQLMFEKLASIVHMDVDVLLNQRIASYGGREISTNKAPSALPKLLRLALGLLLREPSLAHHIADSEQLLCINLPQIKLLFEVITIMKQHDGLTVGGVLQLFEGGNRQLLASIASDETIILLEDLQSEFLDTINSLYALGREQIIAELLNKSRSKTISQEEREHLQRLIKETKLVLNA
ncbi:MAG: DNA primase [Gammaproteobacteria bacterium]|nr:DNA primase [Gammaproteobacteria bacterium]